MFKYVLSFFFKSADSEAPLSLEEAYDLVNEVQEAKNELKNAVEVDVLEELGTYEVLNKCGKITKIDGKHTYTIDDTYNFHSNLSNISIGTRISYQVLKSDGEVQIVDVKVIENDWNVVDSGKVLWHNRTLICEVIERKGRSLLLSPGEIWANLNEVPCEFVPIVGDWIELDVKCEVNENAIDLSGKVIKINQMCPLRPQLKLGKVTVWDSQNQYGMIDRNIYVNKDSLYCGYIPVQGDSVVAEIIESNQGRCCWRALKIIPDYLHSKENKILETVKEEDFQESHSSLNITDNITITFMKLGEKKLFALEIEALKEIELVGLEFPKLNGQCCLRSSIDHHTIKPGRPLTIQCECKAKSIGQNREMLIFYFANFKMRRWIRIVVADAAAKSGNRRDNHRESPVAIPRANQVIKGQRIGRAARFIPAHIPDFPIPSKLEHLVMTYEGQSENLLKKELEQVKPCVVSSLNYMNFEDKFHTLLYLDEIHMKMEMRKYDQERACFIRNGEFLLLEIENLAERRPSVIQGDRVIARNFRNPKSPAYEGVIHKTGKNHVFVKFSQMFHDTYDGEDYTIYIEHTRVTYKRKHFAVNLAVRNLGQEWLFPTKVVEKEPQLDFLVDNHSNSSNTNSPSPKQTSPYNMIGKKRLMEKIRQFQENGDGNVPVVKLEWFNSSLNYYQREAVRNILLGVCRPLPYIIFGPPGTGKTITLVETILQILRLMPHSRILVSAPSNSAADLLALRLIDSGVLRPGDIVRLVAFTAVANMPSRLAPYCATANFEREGTETNLPLVTPNGLVLGYNSSILGRHRITVCTCNSAGSLYNLGFTKGHFSHIIVDEAGQTSEPNLLIPLAFLDTTNGQAVLAGDPMQLGPVVLSKVASQFGLEDSFLERVTCRYPYLRDTEGFPKTHGYDPRLITKLIYNYRSLPTLLKLPSMLFYNDDLQPTISEENSKEAMILEQLKEMLPETKEGKVAQIVFHGVIGENYQMDDSPSWYNPNEASQVFYYVNELFRLGMTASDIGIITPYKAQTKQLIELFREAEFEQPKVGTVEEFQGQEYNIVILSTVRTNNKFISSDIKHSMGFISSPRRLNVSITRARAVMIIVGSPVLLMTDRCWRSVINYCNDKGGYTGASTSDK